MGFRFKYTSFFLKQWNVFNEKDRNFIQDKLRLVKENPFRFPKHEGYKFVFKIKLNIDNKYSRLMYAVFMPDSEHITILGVFDRKTDYKDFQKMFSELKK